MFSISTMVKDFTPEELSIWGERTVSNFIMIAGPPENAGSARLGYVCEGHRTLNQIIGVCIL